MKVRLAITAVITFIFLGAITSFAYDLRQLSKYEITLVAQFADKWDLAQNPVNVAPTCVLGAETFQIDLQKEEITVTGMDAMHCTTPKNKEFQFIYLDPISTRISLRKNETSGGYGTRYDWNTIIIEENQLYDDGHGVKTYETVYGRSSKEYSEINKKSAFKIIRKRYLRGW